MKTASPSLAVSVVAVWLFSIASVVNAADRSAEFIPAVDGTNVKFAVGTSFGDPEVKWGGGSLTVPLGQSYGLQIDGAFVHGSGDNDLDAHGFGTGGHIFWRDPNRALIGAYGHYVRIDAFEDFNLYVLGLEAEGYFDRLSIGILAGIEGGDNGIETGVLAVGSLAYYPTDNLQLSISPSYVYKSTALHFEAEYGVGVGKDMAALFASASLLEGGDQSIGLGLRFYLGRNDKSLIRRHREDDPSLVAPLGSTALSTDITFWRCYANIDGRRSLNGGGQPHRIPGIVPCY